MEELKTLKDFKPEGKFGGVDVKGQSIRIPHWMLKQEAIKWIKDRLDAIKNYNSFEHSTEVAFNLNISNKEASKQLSVVETIEKKRYKDQIWWIKHFFNITEEDVKENGK